MIASLHPLDLVWAILGLAGCLYPLRLMRGKVRSAGAFDFTALMLCLGLFPTAMAIYHLTPFDFGLVYVPLSFLPAVYFFAMTRYLGVRLPQETVLRGFLYTLAAGLALFSLTNVWHGQFAVFPDHIAGAANHLIFEDEKRVGIRALMAVACVLGVGALTLAVVQFSRARFNALHYIVGVGLPAIAIWSAIGAEHPQSLFGYPVNGFLIASTLVLYSTNFSIVARRFLEFRVVTRSTMLSIMPEAMLVVSPQRFIVDANPAFEALLEQSNAPVVNRLLGDVLPSLDQALVAFDGEFECELTVSGERRIFHCSAQGVNPIADSGSQTLLLLRDITKERLAVEALERKEVELRAANSALERMSMTDALTGLKNRRYFQDRLESEYQRVQRLGGELSLIAIDLDHFKQINDRFGHAEGDQALCHVARVLESECRSADTLARVGGEEFMVLMLDVQPSEVAQVAQRLCLALRETPFVMASGQSQTVTASLGISRCDVNDTVDSALVRADEALYEAKRTGRDRMVVL